MAYPIRNSSVSGAHGDRFLFRVRFYPDGVPADRPGLPCDGDRSPLCRCDRLPVSGRCTEISPVRLIRDGVALSEPVIQHGLTEPVMTWITRLANTDIRRIGLFTPERIANILGLKGAEREEVISRIRTSGRSPIIRLICMGMR